MTLYNYTSTTAGVATYQRTVLNHVYLDKGYQQTLSQRGIQTEDQALMILDLSDYVATSGRTFVPAESWQALTTQQKALYFTFRAPDDFIIDGTASETLPNTTKAAMQVKYRCFGISSVAIPASDQAGPALVEVTGR